MTAASHDPSWGSVRTRWTPRAWGTVLLTALIALTACGSGGDPSGGDAGGPTDSLTIALATPQSDILSYVAQARGYFAEEGLEVTMQTSVGSNVSNLVVSGQADLGATTISAPVTIAAQGRPMSVVFGIQGGGPSGSILADPARVQTVDDLAAIPGCTIGSPPQGTSAWGFAKNYIQRFGWDCTLVPFPDAPSNLGALASGRVDAISATIAAGSALVSRGEGVWLINTLEMDRAEQTELIGEPILEAAYFGLKTVLDGKRDAVTKWITAVRKARAYFLDPANTDELVGILRQSPDFADRTPEAIRADVIDNFRHYIVLGSPDDGRISQTEWDAAITNMATWDVPGFTPDNPAFRYDEIVDMSYWDGSS